MDGKMIIFGDDEMIMKKIDGILEMIEQKGRDRVEVDDMFLAFENGIKRS